MSDAGTTEHWRLFVAITVPDRVKASIAEAQSELRRAAPERGITWTKPEQFHLTLRFFGNVEVLRVDALSSALELAVAPFGPVVLRGEHIGAFPDLRYPRVIWAGLVDPEHQLVRVQRAVETACSAFATQPAEDRFSGHITLGRVKHLSRREAQVLTEHLSAMAGRSFGAWTAPGMELMRSQLSSKGAQHSSIKSIPWPAAGGGPKRLQGQIGVNQ